MTDFNSNLNNLFRNYQKLNAKNLSAKERTKLNNEKNALMKDKNLFDINGDGLFNQQDVDMFVKGDVNGDGKITKEELNFISKYKSNLKSAFASQKSDFELDGKRYVGGKLASGIVDDKYYVAGSLTTGTYKGKYYVKGELANGIANSKVYSDGVEVKELSKLLTNIKSAQTALNNAQKNYNTAKTNLDKANADLASLKQKRANLEELVKKNPKNTKYKNQLNSVKSSIKAKETTIKSYQNILATRQTALKNAQKKFDTAQTAFINQQISLIKQGKVSKVYNADGSLLNGKIENKVFKDGVLVSSIPEGEQGSVSYAINLLKENINPKNINYDKEGRVISFTDAGNSDVSYKVEYHVWNDNVHGTSETRTTITKNSAIGANNRTERKEFSGTGVLHNSTEIIRDKSGNKLQETYSNYDDKGTLKYFSETKEAADGTFISGLTKEYNDEGTLIKESSRDVNGQTIKEYDDKGNLMKEGSTTFIGEIEHFEEKTYSSSGLILTWSDTKMDDNSKSVNYYYYNDNGELESQRNTVYDSQGRVIEDTPDVSKLSKKTFVYAEDGSYTVTKYDENGNIINISKIAYDENGQLYEISNIDYDADGNEINGNNQPPVGSEPVLPQKGSFEHISTLLSEIGGNMEDYKGIETDEQGRIIALHKEEPKENGFIERTNYHINYANGGVLITIEGYGLLSNGRPGPKAPHTYLYNPKNQLIRESKAVNAEHTESGFNKEIRYAQDGGRMERTTYIQPQLNNGIRIEEKVVNADGSYTVKKFDTNGNLVSEETVNTMESVIIKKPEKGSVVYVAQLLEKAGINSLANENLIFEPEYDEMGNVTRLTFAGFKNVPEGKTMQPPQPSLYEIVYTENSVRITANNGLELSANYNSDGELLNITLNSETIFEKSKPVAPVAPGEVGSAEFFATRVGMAIDPQNIKDASYDAKGRLTEFTAMELPGYWPENAVSRTVEIVYNDDFSISVKVYLNTMNIEGEIEKNEYLQCKLIRDENNDYYRLDE